MAISSNKNLNKNCDENSQSTLKFPFRQFSINSFIHRPSLVESTPKFLVKTKTHPKTFKMVCTCCCQSKKLRTHMICGPDEPYCGPNLPVPSQYLYWSTRPIICYTSTDEPKRSWNLKRRTPNIPDVLYQEMYDKCGNRYF